MKFFLFLFIPFLSFGQEYKFVSMSESVKYSDGTCKTIVSNYTNDDLTQSTLIVTQAAIKVSFLDGLYTFDKSVVEGGDTKLYYHQGREVLIFNISRQKLSWWIGNIEKDGSKRFFHFNFSQNNLN